MKSEIEKIFRKWASHGTLCDTRYEANGDCDCGLDKDLNEILALSSYVKLPNDDEIFDYAQSMAGHDNIQLRDERLDARSFQEGIKRGAKYVCNLVKPSSVNKEIEDLQKRLYQASKDNAKLIAEITILKNSNA